jgi:hypothetical protein
MMRDRNERKILGELQETQDQLNGLLETVADDQDWQPEADRWSFRFIAAHLAVAERECFLDRIQRILEEDDPHFAYYDNTGSDFSQLDLKGSLESWANTRKEIIDLVRSLPEDAWLRRATHETKGEVFLGDILESMVEHDREHIQEVEENLRKYRGKKG